MVRLVFSLWLLIPALGLAAETSPEELRAQIQRLETALEQNSQAQKAKTEAFQALEREKTERFTKKKEEVAEALVNLSVKAFPTPSSAREKMGEGQIQASLVKYANQQFEQLAKVADSDSDEVLPALDPKAKAPELTSFATLKQRLNQVGDQVLTKEGALGAVADMVKARVEAIRAQEKPAPTSEASSSEDHPEAEETTSKKPETTLNERMAVEFDRSAKLAESYFKMAGEKLQGLTDEDKSIAQNEPPESKAPPSRDNPTPFSPPTEQPPQGTANSQNQKTAQPNNQKNPMAQNGQGGQGGAPSSSGDTKSNHPPLAPVKIAMPGSLPDVARLTMESPREADLSALTEATQTLARAATPSEPFAVTPPFQVPPLPISNAPPTPQPVAAEPTRSAATLTGNRTAGSPVAKRDALPDINSPAVSAAENLATTKSSAPISGGEAGVFNVDPKYPTNDGRPPKRINVAFASGGDEEDAVSSPRSVSSLTYNANPGFPLLGQSTPSERRGILSHVGTWCRTIGQVAACSK